MRFFVLAMFAFFSVGCASSGVRFSGITHSSPKLQKDTLALLQPYFLARTGCEQIEAVEADLPGVPAFMKADPNVRIVQEGTVKERWVTAGCGKRDSFDVVFTPDGAGGAFISIEPTPSASHP